MANNEPVYCTEPNKVLDFAYPNRASLVFPKLPNFNFKIVSFNLPNISLGPIQRPTPFVADKVPGDHVNYETLNVEFLLDYDFHNWSLIHSWIRGLGFPSNHDEYKNKPLNRETAIIFIRNAEQKVVRKLTFDSAWPMTLTSDNWDVQVSAIEPMKGRASFAYTQFRFE